MPNVDTIDINDPLLQQEMVEADPDANFFETPPPPDDREFQVKITCESDPTVKRQHKKTGPPDKSTGPLFLNFSLTLRIVDPNQPWDNQMVFDNATSLVMDSSGTSRLHTILRAIGAPALGSMSLAQLRDHAIDVFNSEPTAFIEGQWEARAESQGNKRADKNGWVTVRRGMKNFEKDETKAAGYDHVWMDAELGKVPARFHVTNYIIR
jgi:hypothetical protein